MGAVYQLQSGDEGRKQLYWGAFMQGCSAFHRHRRAGYWLNAASLSALANRRFVGLYRAVKSGTSFVDDYGLGLRCYIEGFEAGYAKRSQQLTVNGLTLRCGAAE
jgi:hypothetical protein